MIVKQYEVGNFSVFCYLIGDEETREGLLIDPSDDADDLLKEAKANGINKIHYIVNTHCHVDHVMGNAEMVKKTGAKILIHEDDALSDAAREAHFMCHDHHRHALTRQSAHHVQNLFDHFRI